METIIKSVASRIGGKQGVYGKTVSKRRVSKRQAVNCVEHFGQFLFSIKEVMKFSAVMSYGNKSQIGVIREEKLW